MFEFLKRNQEPEPDNAMMEMEYISAINLQLLHNGVVKWSDDEIQHWLPVGLYWTSFEWLEEVAKHEFKEDYQVIHEFLEKTQMIMKVNSQKLEADVVEKVKNEL